MSISGYGIDLNKLVGTPRFTGEKVGIGRASTQAEGATSNSVDRSFARLLEQAVAGDAKADDLAARYANGSSQDLHGTMVAVAKADLNLALLVNVRNKLVEAYREVMRMG